MVCFLKLSNLSLHLLILLLGITQDSFQTASGKAAFFQFHYIAIFRHDQYTYFICIFKCTFLDSSDFFRQFDTGSGLCHSPDPSVIIYDHIISQGIRCVLILFRCDTVPGSPIKIFAFLLQKLIQQIFLHDYFAVFKICIINLREIFYCGRIDPNGLKPVCFWKHYFFNRIRNLNLLNHTRDSDHLCLCFIHQDSVIRSAVKQIIFAYFITILNLKPAICHFNIKNSRWNAEFIYFQRSIPVNPDCLNIFRYVQCLVGSSALIIFQCL